MELLYDYVINSMNQAIEINLETNDFSNAKLNLNTKKIAEKFKNEMKLNSELIEYYEEKSFSNMCYLLNSINEKLNQLKSKQNEDFIEDIQTDIKNIEKQLNFDY